MVFATKARELVLAKVGGSGAPRDSSGDPVGRIVHEIKRLWFVEIVDLDFEPEKDCGLISVFREPDVEATPNRRFSFRHACKRWDIAQEKLVCHYTRQTNPTQQDLLKESPLQCKDSPPTRAFIVCRTKSNSDFVRRAVSGQLIPTALVEVAV